MTVNYDYQFSKHKQGADMDMTLKVEELTPGMVTRYTPGLRVVNVEGRVESGASYRFLKALGNVSLSKVGCPALRAMIAYQRQEPEVRYVAIGEMLTLVGGGGGGGSDAS